MSQYLSMFAETGKDVEIGPELVEDSGCFDPQCMGDGDSELRLLEILHLCVWASPRLLIPSTDRREFRQALAQLSAVSASLDSRDDMRLLPLMDTFQCAKWSIGQSEWADILSDCFDITEPVIDRYQVRVALKRLAQRVARLRDETAQLIADSATEDPKADARIRQLREITALLLPLSRGVNDLFGDPEGMIVWTRDWISLCRCVSFIEL